MRSAHRYRAKPVRRLSIPLRGCASILAKPYEAGEAKLFRKAWTDPAVRALSPVDEPSPAVIR